MLRSPSWDGPAKLFAQGHPGQGAVLAKLGTQVMGEATLGKSGGLDLLARVPAKRFPGGAALRKPLVAAGLLWFKLRDHI